MTHFHLKKLPVIVKFKRLKSLGLRQNLLVSLMDGFPQTDDCDDDADNILPNLEYLELYDNRLPEIEPILAKLTALTHLDLSFNLIPNIKYLETLTNLSSLYLCQNKISEIEGIATLKNLRILELGANRIKELDGLAELTNLEELYLGKNKISRIGDAFVGLTKLRVLSMQSNRIQSLYDFDCSTLENLHELYFSHNGITEIDAKLQMHCINITTLDFGNNRISNLENVSLMHNLEELWINNNQLNNFNDIESQLKANDKLSCLYLEGNPLAADTQFRLKIKLALPQLQQLDATYLKSE